MPGISFLSPFFCKEWKADRASGPSLPLLQPCYWNSHIPRTVLQAASLSSLCAPEILSGWRVWEYRVTARRSQDCDTHTFLPYIAHRFPSEPWLLIASCQTFWMGVQSDITRAMSGESPTSTFVQGKPPPKSLEGKGLGQISFLLVSFITPLQMLLSHCVWPRYQE